MNISEIIILIDLITLVVNNREICQITKHDRHPMKYPY